MRALKMLQVQRKHSCGRDVSTSTSPLMRLSTATVRCTLYRRMVSLSLASGGCRVEVPSVVIPAVSRPANCTHRAYERSDETRRRLSGAPPGEVGRVPDVAHSRRTDTQTNATKADTPTSCHTDEHTGRHTHKGDVQVRECTTCACIIVPTYECVCIHACMCVYVCIHACMYVCMCVYVYMHVCM